MSDQIKLKKIKSTQLRLYVSVCVCVCLSDLYMPFVQCSAYVCVKRGVGTDGKSKPTTGMSQYHVRRVPSAPVSKLTVFFH